MSVKKLFYDFSRTHGFHADEVFQYHDFCACVVICCGKAYIFVLVEVFVSISFVLHFNAFAVSVKCQNHHTALFCRHIDRFNGKALFIFRNSCFCSLIFDDFYVILVVQRIESTLLYRKKIYSPSFYLVRFFERRLVSQFAVILSLNIMFKDKNYFIFSIILQLYHIFVRISPTVDFLGG